MRVGILGAGGIAKEMAKMVIDKIKEDDESLE